jgi:hypothetical protein
MAENRNALGVCRGSKELRYHSAVSHFDFVRDEKLRDSLEADHRELRLCLDAGAYKAVHVLSGSLAEALLIDALAAKPVARPTPLDELTLGPLVTLARSEGVLSQETENLTTVVRQYRNLIHPGRVKRLEKTVDKSGAVVAGTPPFTVSATASSGLTVRFNSRTTRVCKVSGTTVTLIAVGTCTIQATQPGNTDYAAAPPSTRASKSRKGARPLRSGQSQITRSAPHRSRSARRPVPAWPLPSVRERHTCAPFPGLL